MYETRIAQTLFKLTSLTKQPSGNEILAIIEGWSYLRGYVLSTILNGDASGTKVSGHFRECGCSSGVAIKRASTEL